MRAPSWLFEFPAYVLLSVSLVALGLASGHWILVAPFLLAVAAHPLLGSRRRLPAHVALGLLGRVRFGQLAGHCWCSHAEPIIIVSRTVLFRHVF